MRHGRFAPLRWARADRHPAPSERFRTRHGFAAELVGQAGDGLIERLQILVGGHGGGEGLDVALEVRKEQMVVMKGAHLRERLRGVPMAEGEAIEGHHDAGAIGAHAAMDEGLAIAVGAQQSEQGNDLLRGRARHWLLHGRPTNLMPRDSTWVFSAAMSSWPSGLKRTTVSMPSFFNWAYAAGLGCAPR